MKKLFVYTPVLLALLWACDPMDSVYDDLDSVKEPLNEAVELVLSADDYTTASSYALKDAENASDTAFAKAIKDKQAFNQKYTATNYMYPVLATNFLALNKGSVALVTYNTTIKPEYLVQYEVASDYKLAKADYESVGGMVALNETFFPSEPAEKYLPGLLTAKYPEAEAGTVVAATYNYSTIEGGAPAVFLDYPFDGYESKDVIDQDGWTQEVVSGTKTWSARIYSENGYAQFSSYGSAGADEVYLISPEMKLVGSNNIFSFDVNVGFYTHDALTVLISSDYDGSNFGTATWKDVTASFSIPSAPASGYGTMASAGTLKLSDYSGNIHVAFKYNGDGSAGETSTVQVDNVVVKQEVEGDAITISPEVYSVFYEFNGTTWSTSKNVYMLRPFDYDQMGAPGKYNNFSASASPANYLPTFLQLTQPYAQEGQALVLVYQYYDGKSTSKKADEYMFSMSSWTSSSNADIYTSTDQFVHNGQSWVFDPTIKFKMIGEDYQLVVNHVKNNIGVEYLHSSGNSEYYYGGSSRYSNFDTRISKRIEYSVPTGVDGKTFADLPAEEASAIIWTRLQEGIIEMLKAKFPSATTTVGGIDVYYEVSFYSYEDDLSSSWYTYKFKCTKNGPSPEFEFVEDITE